MNNRIDFFAYCFLLFLAALLLGCANKKNEAGEINEITQYSYTHPILFSPKTYVAPSLDSKIEIDGSLDDDAWQNVMWTEDFVDIQGDLEKAPTLKTRAKVAWNNEFLFVGALMEEPHIWATITERDAIMYHDDDFEIFIDPDGDGHNYFEFEMNAYNAIWDLYMLYPYFINDERNYIMNWDIRGIQSAVKINGTINEPSDIDDSWSIEVAIPWKTFEDFKKDGGKPQLSDQWRINFSRVDWTMDIVQGAYTKRTNEEDSTLPEDNWVWSPTGSINMHKPETWGYVQFENKSDDQFEFKEEEKIKWALWQLFYQMKECNSDKQAVCNVDKLSVPKVDIEEYNFNPDIVHHNSGFAISANALNGGRYVIDHRGQLTLEEELN